MWHEARKQERKIRGMMVDYQKRSERRRIYYQRIRADPTQFLRLNGTPYKIYVEDEAREISAMESDLMPWQGDKNTLIDRFDVRAHLDIIPEYNSMTSLTDPLAHDENAVINQKCHYERWRTLATNDLVGLTEEECLAQIIEDEKIILPTKGKKVKSAGARIGYSYDKESESESDEEEAEFLPTELDFDITFDVRDLDAEHKHRLNEIAADKYSIPDFTRLHVDDKDELELREFEMREEHTRMVRISKLSKHERRKEKEHRRKTKELPAFYKVDDPHRNPIAQGSSRRKDESESSSEGEEKTVQHIEISSSRSNTYKNVKPPEPKPKSILPFLAKQSTASSGILNLAAKRRQLMSNAEEEISFGPSNPEPEESPSNNEASSRARSHNRSRSSSRRRSQYDRRRQSRSRSRSASSRSRSRSKSRTRTNRRSRNRSRNRSRERAMNRNSPPKTSAIKKSTPSSATKQLKPHERLKLKLQSQLKKQVRNERKKEILLEEQKEQEAMERDEELRVLKRRMWEKEDEEYWRKRELEDEEHRKNKEVLRSRSTSTSRSHKSRSQSPRRRRSRSRRRRSRSTSKSRSSPNNNPKRHRSKSSKSPRKSPSKDHQTRPQSRDHYTQNQSRERMRDDSREGMRDESRDLAREHPRDGPRDQPRDRARHNSRERMRDESRYDTRDEYRDDTRDREKYRSPKPCLVPEYCTYENNYSEVKSNKRGEDRTRRDEDRTRRDEDRTRRDDDRTRRDEDRTRKDDRTPRTTYSSYRDNCPRYRS